MVHVEAKASSTSLKLANKGHLLEDATFNPTNATHVAKYQVTDTATGVTPSLEAAEDAYNADQAHWYAALMSCLDSSCALCKRARLRCDKDTTVARRI